MMDTIVLWLLTYVLHSTVLLGAAALARIALGERRLALQEAMLRAALLGGFLTASLQLALHVQPLGGSLPLHKARLEVAAPALIPQIAAHDRASVLARRAGDATMTVEHQAVPSGSRTLAPAVAPSWMAAAQRAWRPALLILWGSLALIGAVRLALGARRLRQLLRDRQPLGDAPISAGTRAIASVLGLRSPVRLSTAPRLAVPLATGVLRPEVCLPTRVFADLREEEQLALCAHELAHLARRDPAWLLLVRIAGVLAPVQPLNRWARQRLSELAECFSDDLAVSASAQPLGLARSLVDVASWTLAVSDAVPATAAGAFSSRSRLAYRVERLMDPVRVLERPRRIFLALAGVATLATAFVVPVVSGNASDKPAAKPSPSPVVAPQPVAAPAPIVAPPPGQAPSPPPAPPVRPQLPVAGPAGREGVDAAEAIERLTQRIEQRARGHQREMAKIEAEINAQAARFGPQGEEMARLGRELAQAANDMAREVTQQLSSGHDAPLRRGKDVESARHMAELRRQIVELAGQFRIPSEDVDALREKARALAELARPTDRELAEIRRLAEELTLTAAPKVEEAARIAAEAAARAQRDILRAREQAQRAQQRAQRALERAREQATARAKAETQESAEPRDATPQEP
jgi:beta-lactamase regulating signal transducer with metallopeptidase domain